MPGRSDKRSPKQHKADRPWRDRWIVGSRTAVLLGQKPWGGPTACVLVTWCPADWLLATDWTSLKGELEIGAYMKKREKKRESAATRSAVDEQFAAEYGVLYDYLTATCYDDDPKQPRATATLLVFAQDGCWKACLRDRAEGCCAWCAAPGFVELLAVLERELGEGTVVWREDRAAGAPEAKRKPRQQGT